jgi:hypothetical protein
MVLYTLLEYPHSEEGAKTAVLLTASSQQTSEREPLGQQADAKESRLQGRSLPESAAFTGSSWNAPGLQIRCGD